MRGKREEGKDRRKEKVQKEERTAGKEERLCSEERREDGRKEKRLGDLNTIYSAIILF